MRLLCAILKVNNDLERIADCAVNIAERTKHLDPDSFRDDAPDIRSMCPLVRQILHQAVQAYSTADGPIARKVLTDDEAIDATYGQFVRDIVTQSADSPDEMAALLDLLSVAKNLERIADHAVNIAEDVIFLATGEIVRHRNI
jgi:phosphate transport system protein